MIRSLFCSLGYAALSFGLVCAPLSVAFAGQTITIDGSTVSNNVYGNGNAPDGSASTPSNPSSMGSPDGNTVIISNNGTVTSNRFVHGGHIQTTSDPAEARNNTVTIDNGSVSNYVRGGNAQSNTGSAVADSNTVNINNGQVTNMIYGGWAESTSGSAEVTGNNVNITNNVTVGFTISGGHVSSNSSSATAAHNIVDISGSALTSAEINGGEVLEGATVTVTENQVNARNSTVTGSIYGGKSNSNGGSVEVQGNKVTIDNSTIGASIAGSMYVYGGYAMTFSGSTAVTNNSVTITNGSTVNYMTYGGYASDPFRNSVEVSLNSVTITNGSTVNNTVYGGYASGGTTTATDNSVIINNSTVAGNVYAGRASGTTGTVTTTGNSVAINSGTVTGNVYGGNTTASTSGTATTINNSVTISGGTVNGDIYGGYASSNSGNATATGNTIIINGGTVTGNVYGGYANTTSGTTTAQNNTITISGNVTFGQDSSLYGEWPTGGGDAFTGNTLNLSSTNVTVSKLEDFQNLNFYLPTTVKNKDIMLITHDEANISNTNVQVGFNGASSLRPGNYVVLIDASAGTLIGEPSDSSIITRAMKGSTLEYDAEIVKKDTLNQLWLQLLGEDPTVNPKTESLSQGYLTGISLLNQGSDLIAGWGMRAAIGAATHADQQTGYGVFGAVSGGSMSYNTGSHTNLSSVSLITGLSQHAKLNSGNLVLGAFFEYGNGSYDTYTDIHGDGNLYYMGGGILGRMDFTNTDSSHFYAEASARGGSVHNNYNNSELQDFWGIAAQYDSSAAYYGIHVGTGYIWNMTDKTTLDLYGKYFWTRQDGDSVHLSTGETIDFDGINSHRLRTGARFSYAVDEILHPYIGAAYEREFKGDANATTDGYAIGVPSLKGNTGIGEFGLTFKPTSTLPLLIDLGIQGYVGTQEGVIGTAQIRYDF